MQNVTETAEVVYALAMLKPDATQSAAEFALEYMGFEVFSKASNLLYFQGNIMQMIRATGRILNTQIQNEKVVSVEPDFIEKLPEPLGKFIESIYFEPRVVKDQY